MRRNEGDFLQLKKEVCDNNRPLICYGAGMAARHIGCLLEKYGLLNKVLFWIDSDSDKANLFIRIEGRDFAVREKGVLRDSRHKEAVLLITCENGEEIVDGLQKDEKITICDYWLCLPVVNKLISQVIRKEPKIPRKIHYCWFGEKEIPDRQKRFIEEWYKLCPDYEFYFWNESNYELTKCRYISEAYEMKCYAFVSDYVRMDVIYQYGGFYFDTDVKLMKNIDLLRQYEAFFTYGKWPAINSGSGFGAVKGSELVREIRDNPRESISFYENGKLNKTTNCCYETDILRKHGFHMDFTTQNIGNIRLFSPGYFPTYTYAEDYGLISDDVIAIHYDAGSWRKR
ncbi:glycosyltransferase [Lachnospiraceae bacterium 54-11]